MCYINQICFVRIGSTIVPYSYSMNNLRAENVGFDPYDAP